MTVLRSKQKVATTAWEAIVGPVGAGKIVRVDLDATNITAGGVYAAASVRLVDTPQPANSGVKRNAYPLPPPPDDRCTVILLYSYILSEGQSLEVKAAAADSVSFGFEGQEMAALDA